MFIFRNLPSSYGKSNKFAGLIETCFKLCLKSALCLFNVDGYKSLRLDRTKCGEGGCVICYADHLKVVHRKDLEKADFETIWIQVKFPMGNVLFAVAYRSELKAPNFFNDLSDALEKAWLKSSHIFLLTDSNCDLLDCGTTPGKAVPLKTRKLLHIFDSYSLHKVIKEPTRVTQTSELLIDLIATTRLELVRKTGVIHLGISNHGLIYATMI